MTTYTEPTAVIDRAHAALRQVVAALSADDLALPTPCAGWTVAHVLQHAAGDQRAYVAALTGEGGPTEDPFAPSGELAESPGALVEPALAASAAAFALVEPGSEVSTPLPIGPVPALSAAGAAAIDAAVHAWDVAVATGQDSPLDDDLAAFLLSVAPPLVEPVRPYGVYAAALDAPGGADPGPADALLRYLGRDPRWTAVVPTRIEIPQADLDDVRERLARTRFTDALEPDEGYGTSVASVRELVRYWLEDFDWRALEARLNAYPQVETVIDGQRVHALHVRSGRPDAVGLVLTHGWPGSVLEYLDVIEPLTAAGYDVVLPSIPGFGFSGPTTEAGWDNRRVARAWVELMRRLGYERYGAVGNDAGSMISPEVGRLDPEHVVGVHVTQLYSFPSGDPAEMADLSEEEQAALAHLGWFWENLGGFNVLQSQQPQTLAHALADSPAGLLGWNSQLMGDVGTEFVVANAAVYWFTGTQGSALRMYRENALAQQRAGVPEGGGGEPSGPTTVPTALAQATGDFASIRRFAERDHADIRQWTTYERGGHFAAHLEPEQTAGDVVGFFDGL
jgi:uncharacterized protein (TIGR03086 family)